MGVLWRLLRSARRARVRSTVHGMDGSRDVTARVDDALRQAAQRAYAAAHGTLGEEPDSPAPPRWRWEMSPRVAVTLAVAVGIVGALVVWAPRPVAGETSAPATADLASTTGVHGASTQGQGTAAAAPRDATGVLLSAAEVNVHVVGAVLAPGVYSLPVGSRVTDAIDAAGGPTDDAQLDSINLARPLADGEQVRVLTHDQAAMSVGMVGDGRVNINTANSSQLEELPGVGPVLADRIVAYRDQHGPFASVTALEAVTGFGPAIVAGLADAAAV